MENQTDPLFLLFSVAIAQFLLLLLLVYKKRNKNKSELFLLLLLILSMTFIVIDFLLTWSGYLAMVPQLLGTSYSFIYLLGPILYGLVSIADTKKFPFLYPLHFLPFLFALLAQLLFLQGSAAAKLDYYENMVATEQEFSSFRYIWKTVLRAIFLLAYVAWAGWNKRTNGFSWDRVNKSIWMVFAVVGVLLLVHAFLLAFQLPFYALTYCIIISLIGFLGFWLNWLLIFSPTSAPEPHQPQAEKYQKSGLPDAVLSKEAQRIQEIMDIQKPYLNPDLKLAQLCEITQLSTHHLSQIINKSFDKNYADFINGYRIAYAKNQLLATEEKRTIQEIAFEAGFNSTNSFNRAFKKMVGTTPSDFRINANNN